MEPEAPKEHPKRKQALWITTLAFLAIGLALFLVWLFIWRFEVSTKDAYVHGNQVVVSPQIAGFVTEVTVDDTDVVERGKILVELDKTDRLVAYDEAKNQLADKVRRVASLFENTRMLKAELEAKKAAFAFAAQEFKHRKKLVGIGGVSKEDFERAQTGFIGAFAELLAISHKLKGAQALTENTTVRTHPEVLFSINQLQEAFVNLNRCTIRSPVDGIIAMKKVQVGESIFPESPLLTVTPLNQIWVNANYKETHLRNVRIGQPVTMRSDIYGSEILYQGKVVGISAGTGSVFSVLPPQNATGNWIKIVQRLPVRIALEPHQLAHYPLRLGLSMDVTISTRDTRGDFFPTVDEGTLYTTDVFEQQEVGVDQVIETIFEENLPQGVDEPTDRTNA